MLIEYNPIGIIHTPFTKLEGMPIQPSGAAGVQGRIEVYSQFQEGLSDLEGFSHLILLYHFHCSKGVKLTVTPFLDSKEHGVFATRAPRRPNAIGLSVVKLLQREDHILYVENVDILTGTPLIDIKPYVPEFDLQMDNVRTGWVEAARGRVATKKSDNRFI